MIGVSIIQFSFIQETVHCKDRAQFLNSGGGLEIIDRALEGDKADFIVTQ